MEFIAILVALLHVIKLRISSASIRLIGDNVSALTWAKKKQYKTGRSTKAAVVFAILSHRHDILIQEVVHIAGVNNTVCDKLSRGATPQTLNFPADCICSYDRPMEEFLQLINPLQLLSGELDEFIEFWNSVSTVLDLFTS